ncbi:O-antigen ligase family protein [Ruminiclostridium hungatei]|nr:O-antigen ligase family protein [Ruminiclostridium hungatei]
MDRLILAAIFLAPCSNIFMIKTGYMDLKVLQFLWLGIFTCILLTKTYKKDIYPDSSKTHQSVKIIFALYLTGILLSCLFSVNMKISVKELFQYIYLFLMMLVIYKQSQRQDFLNRIVSVLIISNIVLVVTCLASYYFGKMLIPSFRMYPDGHIVILDQIYKTQALVESKNVINRIDGVMGLDTIAIANCILIQSMAVNYKIRKSIGRTRLLYCILFIADVLTLSLTYSRAALLIFFVLNIVTLFGKSPRINFLIIVISICCVPVILSIFPNLLERMLEALNTQEGSTKYHFVYWLIALQEGYDHIVSGIGLGNAAFHHDAYAYLFEKFRLYKSDAVDVHNFVLQVWAEQGSIGLSANLLLVTYPIVRFVKLRFIDKMLKEKTLFDFLITAYIATLAYNLTNNNFYLETFWIMAAIVYACSAAYPSAKTVLKPGATIEKLGGSYEEAGLKADF